jgi:hypothetical protein
MDLVGPDLASGRFGGEASTRGRDLQITLFALARACAQFSTHTSTAKDWQRGKTLFAAFGSPFLGEIYL